MEPATTIPATVTVLAKHSLSPRTGHEPPVSSRVLTVKLGDHEWDVYVPADQFADAMEEVVKHTFALCADCVMSS